MRRIMAGDDHATWTWTRSMAGIGLAGLRTGQKPDLTIEHHDAFSVVSAYTLRD